MDEEDSFHEKAPRLSVYLNEDEDEDENDGTNDDDALTTAPPLHSAKTARSVRDVEAGRRQDVSRLSLGGLALETLSDRFVGLEEYGIEDPTGNLTGVFEHIGAEDTQAFLEGFGAMDDEYVCFSLDSDLLADSLQRYYTTGSGDPGTGVKTWSGSRVIGAVGGQHYDLPISISRAAA